VLRESVDVSLAPPADRVVATGRAVPTTRALLPPSVPHVRLGRAVVRRATGLRTAGGPGAAALW